MVHLLKQPEYKVLKEMDSLLLGLWKLFEYSPNKFGVFVAVQEAYGSSPLKLIRAATTRYIQMVIHF
jgi:hypothetical protein